MSEENRCDKIIPTNTIHIENMNEAQLEQEIAKSDRKLLLLKKTMDNNIVATTPDVGLIPINQINGYNDKTKNSSEALSKADKQMNGTVNKAVAYTKAKSDYDAEKKRNNALIKALNTVKGTGKTTKQIRDEILADIAKSSKMKWVKSTQNGVTVRKSGDFVIRSTGSVFFIYKNGEQIGMTNKLRDATAFVELYNKRGENNG